MKLKVEKALSNGEYKVRVEVGDFSQDEQNRIEKFGSPSISLEPQKIYERDVFGDMVRHDSYPLHALNHSFSFEDEYSAESFAQVVAERIRTAITELKNRQDDFSGKEEYEL